MVIYAQSALRVVVVVNWGLRPVNHVCVRERERERETDRQTDRQTDRDRQTERDRERDRHRQTD